MSSQHERQQDRQPDENRYDYGPSPVLQTQLEALPSPTASPEREADPPPLQAPLDLTPSVLAAPHCDHQGSSTPVGMLATPSRAPSVLTPLSGGQNAALASLTEFDKGVDVDHIDNNTPDDKLMLMIEKELFAKAQYKQGSVVDAASSEQESVGQAALRAEVEFWQAGVANECKVHSLRFDP